MCIYTSLLANLKYLITSSIFVVSPVNNLCWAAAHILPTTTTTTRNNKNTFWSSLFLILSCDCQRCIRCRSVTSPKGEFHNFDRHFTGGPPVMFRTVAQLGRRLRYAGTFYFTRNKIFPNFPKTEAIKRYLSAAYCESFRVPNNSSTKKAARQGFFFFCGLLLPLASSSSSAWKLCLFSAKLKTNCSLIETAVAKPNKNI